MAKLTKKIASFIHAFLDPGYSARQAEADYLREIYRDNANAVVRRNQFYRLVNEVGALVGFEFVCLCGQAYKLLDVNLWSQSHSCPTCKNRFDLFKAVSITKETPQVDWPGLFAQLPMRPSAVASVQRPPFLDTWAENKSDEIEYVSYDPCAGGLFK